MKGRKKCLTPLPPPPLPSHEPAPYRYFSLGGNFQTSVAGWMSITAWSQSSMQNRSDICTFRHLPAFPPVTFPTDFNSSIWWYLNRLQFRKRCSHVWDTLPPHHQHLSSSKWPNRLRWTPVGACPHFSRWSLAASEFMLVVGIGLLVSAVPWSLWQMWLLHQAAYHFALAADLRSVICLALFEAEVYGRSITVLLIASYARFTWEWASSFPGMPQCPFTKWISVAVPWARRLHAVLSLCLARRCPGPGSSCAFRWIEACELLKTDNFFAPCVCNVSLFTIATSGGGPIAHSSPSKTSICPVPK